MLQKDRIFKFTICFPLNVYSLHTILQVKIHKLDMKFCRVFVDTRPQSVGQANLKLISSPGWP